MRCAVAVQPDVAILAVVTVLAAVAVPPISAVLDVTDILSVLDVLAVRADHGVLTSSGSFCLVLPRSGKLWLVVA